MQGTFISGTYGSPQAAVKFPSALASIYLGIFLAAAMIGNASAEDISGGTFNVPNNSPERRALKQQMAINGVQVTVVQSEPDCTKYQCVFNDEFHYGFNFHQGLTCEDWTKADFNAMTGYSRVHVKDDNADSISQNGHSRGITYNNYTGHIDLFFIDSTSAAEFISRCNPSPDKGVPNSPAGALKIVASTDGLGNIRLDVINSSKSNSMELDSYVITKCIGIVECGNNTFAMVIPPGMTRNVTSITRGNTDANGNQPAMSFTYCWTYRALGKGADPSKVFKGCDNATSAGGGPMTSQGQPGPTPAQPAPTISNPNDPTADPAWQDRNF